MDGRDELSLPKTVAKMYQLDPDVGLLAERAADNSHRRYLILTGSETFAQAPRDVRQFPDYPDTISAVRRFWCGGILEFPCLTFGGEVKLRAEQIQTLWYLIINVGDEQRHGRS